MGLVDSAIIFFITLGVFLILKRMWILLGLCLIIGVLAKETIILIFPFLCTFLEMDKTITLIKKMMLVFVYIIIVAATYYLVRKSVIGIVELSWVPRFGKFIANVKRPYMWINLIISFGIPGFLAIFHIIKNFNKFSKKIDFTFMIGLVFAFLVFLFAIVAVYADGRYVWLTYPFSIPLAISYISTKIEQNKFKLLQKIIFYASDKKLRGNY